MLSLGNKLTLNTQPIYHFVNKYSIDFDGVDDRIITDGADTVAQPTTYSFWCKSSETGFNAGVFGHGASNRGAFHFNWNLNRPLLYLSDQFYKFWVANDEQSDGEWHHWVVYSDTNDITNSKLYIDGVLQNESFIVSSGSANVYTESLTIGSDQAVGGNSFEGKIDEFAVYDRELTQDEITRMYNTYYSPNRVANGNFSQIGNEEVTNGDFSQIGSEQVTNGNFSDGENNWSFGTGWSIIDGKATVVNQTGWLASTGAPILANKQIKLQFDVVLDGGTLRVKNNTNDFDETFNTVGSYTITRYYSTGGSASNLQFPNYGSGFSGSIDNVSVKEVGQGFTFDDGWGMGENKAIKSASSSDANLTQSSVFTVGKIYKIVFNIESISGTVWVSGISDFIQHTTTGEKTVISTSTSANITLRSSSTSEVTITNISVKEVGQHWTFGDGWSTDGTKLIGTNVSTQFTQQSVTFISGRLYKVSFDITGADTLLNDTSFRYPYDGEVGNITYLPKDSPDGTYTNTFTSTGSSVLYLGYIDGGTFTGTVDNIVVQELKHDATNLMLNAGAYQSANPLITSTKSMEFDGTDNYLSVSDSDDLDIGTNDFSVSAWIKTTATNGTVMAKRNSSVSSGAGYEMGLSNGKVSYYFKDASGNAAYDTEDTITVNDGKWHHIAWVFDRSGLGYRYIDGVNSGTNDSLTGATGSLANTGVALGIGARIQASADNEFDGKITEAGIYNRALTSLEVASLYNQGMPTNLLVNRNNYQSGNPTVFNTKQVDFDGSDDYLKVENAYGSFTGSVSMWFKRDSTGNPMYLIDARGDSIGGTGYILVNSSVFTVNSGTRYVDGVAQTTMPTDSDWHHMVVTGMTLDIDEDLKIGSRYNQTEELEGNISQVGIWNSTLTADEVSSLYNHGLPIDLTTDQAAYESSSNLVGYWRMGSGTLDTYPLIADQTNATLGSELVTNGDFATDSDWTKGTGWSIANGKATTDGTINTDLEQNCTETGKTYYYSVTYSASGTFSSRIRSGSTGTIINIQEAGTHNGYFIANGVEFEIVTLSDNTISYSIDNVSVKEVQGNPAIMTNQTSSDIENGSPYANLVQNGTFDTDSDWNLRSVWTISANKCNAPSGTTVYLSQSNILLNNTTYNATLDIVVISGSLSLQYFNGSFVTVETFTSSQSVDIKFLSTSTDSTLYFLPSSFEGNISNVSVSEVNTGLQGYWKMGDGTNDEYPVIYDQTNPTLSSELIVNGDFSNGTNNWTNNGTSTLSVSNGVMTINRNTSSVSNQCYQELTTVNGSQYIFSINQIAASQGIQLVIGGTTYSNFPVTLGIRRILFTASSTTTRISINPSDSSTATAQIDDVSVKLVSGNPATMTNMVEGNITNQFPLTKIRNYYRMGDGILDGYPIIQDQTSPNLAHIPTTNIITYSEDFSQSVWAVLGSRLQITIDNIIAPDGTLSGTKLEQILANTDAPIRFTGLTAGLVYTFSIYAKKGNYNKMRIDISDDTTDFTLTEDWVRYSITETSSSNFVDVGITLGSVGDFIYIWGAQVEEQSQATPYLKSDGIAAVRKSSTTNLITYSEDFSQASQLQNVTLTANAITSPIGTSNGTKVLSSDNNSKVSYTSLNFVAGTIYTVSVFCKNIDATSLNLFVYMGGAGGDITYNFTSQVNTSDWTRVSLTFVATGTNSQGQVQFARNLPNGQSAYFWGFQFEQQTQAETYAPTYGLPVTIDLFTENNYGTMTNMSASDIIEDTP